MKRFGDALKKEFYQGQGLLGGGGGRYTFTKQGGV